MSRPGPIRTNRERGFTLFEVLITIVVVSIGLLGLAGLQFAGLRAANSAQEHTLASLLAQDIQERILANPNSDYVSGTIGPSSTDCIDNYCSPDDLRDFDRSQWYYMINSGGPNGIVLPNASVTIAKCNATNFFKITIQWHGSNDSSDPCDPIKPTGPSTLLATFQAQP